MTVSHSTWFWREVAFAIAGTIEPKRDGNGHILVHAPQERYAKRESFALNKYGAGPFCEFRLRATTFPWRVCLHFKRRARICGASRGSRRALLRLRSPRGRHDRRLAAKMEQGWSALRIPWRWPPR